MTDLKQIYQRLQQHLDRQPVGFPATWSRAEIRFLQRMFTPEEAELALRLSYQPNPTAAVVEQAVGRRRARALRRGAAGAGDGATDQYS